MTELFQIYINRIRKKIETDSVSIARGGATNWDDYLKRTSRLRGLEESLEILEKTSKDDLELDELDELFPDD